MIYLDDICELIYFLECMKNLKYNELLYIINILYYLIQYKTLNNDIFFKSEYFLTSLIYLIIVFLFCEALTNQKVKLKFYILYYFKFSTKLVTFRIMLTNTIMTTFT